MDTTRLTPRERAVFDFIYDELTEGPGPTLAEIGENFDFHATNAWRLVFALTIKGYLRRAPRRHRGLEVTPQGQALREQAARALEQRRQAVTSRARSSGGLMARVEFQAV